MPSHVQPLSPTTHSGRRLVGLLTMVAMAPFAGAQEPKSQEPKAQHTGTQKQQPETFPPASWQQLTIKALTRKDLALPRGSFLTAQNTLQLRLGRPDSFDETVITTADGLLLTRTKEQHVDIPNRHIGERYVIFFGKTKERQTLRFQEGFVRYPEREFPSQGWQPREDATLAITNPKQSTPKTMLEAFDKPHQVSFTAKSDTAGALYLLTKIEAGGKEQVASQSLDGTLAFWMQAKRGESFRIYEIFPETLTYRASKTMTIERDFPIGR